MIAELIACLEQAGLTLSGAIHTDDPTGLNGRELAEALYLALHLPPLKVAVAEADEPTQTAPPPEQPPLPESKLEPAAHKPALDSHKKQPDPTGSLFVRSSGKGDETGVNAQPFRAAAAIALPGAPELARALRPLLKRYPSRTRRQLDVERTVQCIADGGPVAAVEKPVRERWLEVALVVDQSASMHVWRPTLSEWQRLLERHGAFRDVTVWGVNTDKKETRFYRESGLSQPPARLGNPDELFDPQGRRLIMLVSDCIGAGWHSGTAFQLLARWAARAPLVLVQVLPQHLWSETALPYADLKLHAQEAGCPNQCLRKQTPSALSPGLPLPVVTLEDWAVAPWAQLVAARGKAVAPGILLTTAQTNPSQAQLSDAAQAETSAAPAAPVSEAQHAQQLVNLFRASATPLARRLAGYLAAVELNLPVMRLVQQALLPQSRQIHLAEVFLGGLLRQLPADPALSPEEIRYDFLPGVRERLLDLLPPSETQRVVTEVWQLIEKRLPFASDFQVLLAAPHVSESELHVAVGRRAFATISPAALRKIPGTQSSSTVTVPTTTDVAVDAPEFAEIAPGPIANDPWKGAFGGKSARKNRRLTARVEPLSTWPNWFTLTLVVASTNTQKHPLRGPVQFYLHPTFEPAQRVVAAIEGGRHAVLGIQTWGAFTVGVSLDDGRTLLELDLAEQTDLPLEFRYPIWEREQPTRGEKEDFSSLSESWLQTVCEWEQRSLLEAVWQVFELQRQIAALTVTGGTEWERLNQALVKATQERIRAGQRCEAIAAELRQRGAAPRATIQALMIQTALTDTERLGAQREAIWQAIGQYLQARKASDHEAQAAALFTLGQRFAQLDDHQSALQFYEYAQGKGVDKAPLLLEIEILLQTAISYARLNDLKKADRRLEQARKLIEKLSSLAQQANALFELAKVYALLGNSTQAILNAEAALRLSKLKAQQESLQNFLGELKQTEATAVSFKTLEDFVTMHLSGAGLNEVRLQTREAELLRLEQELRQATRPSHRDAVTMQLRNAQSEVEQLKAGIAAQYEEVNRRLQGQLALQQQHGDLLGIAGVQQLLSLVLHAQHKTGAALNLAGEALASYEKLGERDRAARLREMIARWENEPAPFKLKLFTFETVTLDERGKEKERRTLQARQYIETLAEEVTLEMVEIPGGTFAMGSNGDKSEQPIHTVTVPPFFLGKYAVTQAQWRVVAGWPKVEREIGPAPSAFPRPGQRTPKDDQRPVEQVSWEETQEFCARLSNKTGRHYRLPSEAEWEYACRAGTNTPFAFGPTVTPEFVNYDGNYPYGKAPKGEYRRETVPVGSLKVANAFGLYDMHGNVWEWCEDVWHENYEKAPEDGSAWLSGEDSSLRVLRGGSWYGGGVLCRSAVRDWDSPGFRDLGVGFRVVAVSRTRNA